MIHARYDQQGVVRKWIRRVSSDLISTWFSSPTTALRHTFTPDFYCVIFRRPPVKSYGCAWIVRFLWLLYIKSVKLTSQLILAYFWVHIPADLWGNPWIIHAFLQSGFSESYFSILAYKVCHKLWDEKKLVDVCLKVNARFVITDFWRRLVCMFYDAATDTVTCFFSFICQKNLKQSVHSHLAVLLYKV